MKNNALCKLATATFALSITFGCGTGSVPPSDEQTSTSRILDEAPGRSFSEGFIDGCEGHALSYQKWTDDSSAYGTLIFATGRTFPQAERDPEGQIPWFHNISREAGGTRACWSDCLRSF